MVGVGGAVGVDLLVERDDLLVEGLEDQRHFGRRDLERLGQEDRIVEVFGIVAFAVDVAHRIQDGEADGCQQRCFLFHRRTSSFHLRGQSPKSQYLNPAYQICQ